MATQEGTVRAGRMTRGRGRVARTALHPGHPAVLIGIVTGLLALTGLVMTFSSSFVTSLENTGSSFSYFQKQLLWTVAGVAGFVVAVRTDYRKLRRLGVVLYLMAVFLLMLVLLPGVGVTAGGSSRWIGVGSVSFQPSEFTKLALVLFAAEIYTRKKESSLEDFGHTLMPMVPALGVLGALVLWQPDLGTTLLLGAIGIGMLFVAGAPLRHLIPMGSLGATLAFAAAMIEPYRRARILSFLDPWKDPLNTGYQTIQSLIALGSGGLFGVGLGASRQKWLYVPNAHTDFIFAILGEEMGLIGTVVVVGLFAFFAYLGIKTAQRAPDRFGMLVAAGITIWISVQALVNMGAVAAALPITGVPLPLVSFGGTSLVISLVAIGILVNIAMQGRHHPPRKPRRANR
jgi:cell division protein FtsW